MKLTFRWYGEKDCIPLEYIKQIQGMTGVVTAVYDVPVGEVWSVSALQRLKTLANGAGLEMEVIESIPVHEDIKLGKPTRDKLIANYAQNIINCGKVGVKCVCYNFMPVFDWTRSELDHPLPDGSNALVYFAEQVEKMDPMNGELSLPGWDASYTKESLKEVMDAYREITEEDLWNNLKYFLERVIKVAEEVRVKMAIHPDDPPWPIFGLPRIITNMENLERFLKLVDSPYNGLTLCSGSLGASADNDIVEMIRRFGSMGRIHFAHCRNVLLREGNSFEEAAHLSEKGSLDMYEIMKAYHDVGFDGPVRPDHGRMIWGEQGRPGYGLYDRALGAVYLNGLWEAIEKNEAKG